MTFFMIVLEKAKSYNSKNKMKRSYIEKLLESAKQQVVEQNWSCSDHKKLYARIYYFHRKQRDIDADNMSKPILDALKGIVFTDDKQIIWRDVVKINMYEEFALRDIYLPEKLHSKLLEDLNNEIINDIIFIEIGHLMSINLSFGREPK